MTDEEGSGITDRLYCDSFVSVFFSRSLLNECFIPLRVTALVFD